jgi:phage terminase large subunit GpA-like protein
MITAEVRVLKRARSGVVTSSWELAEPGRRNEALDTMNYAEAAARRKGWASLTEEQWAAMEDERDRVPDAPQGDLFDAAVTVVVPPRKRPDETTNPAKAAPATSADWIKPRGKWI